MIRFDYNKLLADFEHDLNEKLRSHSARHECLDLWVPSPNLEESLEGLIESAFEMGENKFEILLSSPITDEANLPDLVINLKHIARIDWEKEETSIIMSVFPSSTETDLENSSKTLSRSNTLKNPKNIQTEKYRASHLPTEFKTALLNLRISENHEEIHEVSSTYSVEHNEKKICVSLNKDGVLIGYKVESPNRIASSFLCLLCNLLIQKPVREVIDHGINHTIHYLYKLVKKNGAINDLPSILLPTNLGPEIEDIRPLLALLKEKLKHEIDFTIKNTYSVGVSENWNHLTAQEKTNALQSHINEFRKKFGYTVKEIEFKELRNSIEKLPVRVFIQSTVSVPSLKHLEIIKRLENHLKENLEQALQVYYTENVDENILRRLGKE